MNDPAPYHAALPGAWLHPVAVWLLAALAAAAWVVWHRLLRPRLLRRLPGRIPSRAANRNPLTSPPRAATGPHGGARMVRILGRAGGVLPGWLALGLFWRAMAGHVMLATPWPLSVHALLGAAAVEFVLAAYALERRLAGPGAGSWLTGLRLTALLAILTILVQPVFARRETRRIDRNVVILLDESASMQRADSAMPVAERLALARQLGLAGLEERPDLAAALEEGQALALRLEQAVESVRPPDGALEEDARALVERQSGAVRGVLQETGAWADRVMTALEAGRPVIRTLSQPLREQDQALKQHLSELLRETLAGAAGAIARGEDRKLRALLQDAGTLADHSASDAAGLAEAVDDAFYQALSPELRQAVDAAAGRPRRELAWEALNRPAAAGQPSLRDQLAATHTLRYLGFGRDTVETAVPGTSPWPAEDPSALRTDLSAALAKVQETWPAESLAGVILLSDARHNGPRSPDDAARRLGLQGSPVFPVLTGSAAGVRDAAVADVTHPGSIFLGDRLRISADLKFSRLRGRQVKVSLLRGEEKVREETVTVPQEDWTTSLRLEDTPPGRGIFEWKVVITPPEGDAIAANNTWSFRAAVSDDRTHVLLIDDRPRWEFRYLRNLFDSRDKSVQLQYVLLHPDTIEGAGGLPAIPAAAGRRFGESEATRLPATAEEWRKFDVIILGDVPPEAVDGETWKILRGCVGSRGATLILVAGRNFLPGAHTHAAARELVPLKYGPQAGAAVPPEPAYRLALTAEGRGSPVFSLSDSGVENARLWEQMPVLTWRFGHQGIKEGARVLAYARPVPVDGEGLVLEESASDPLRLMTDADPAGELLRRRRMEQDHALVAAMQVDLGKVVMLAFDQTWRFRYGTGDTWHHRFWGQLLREGAGESLPAGTASVRLGTDLLTCAPGQPVQVRARLRDEESRPVRNARVQAIVRGPDGQTVASTLLQYRPDSQGLYEGGIGGLLKPGTYTVELSGPEVERLSAADGAGVIRQPLTVAGEGNAVELGDLSVDHAMAARLASLSGGAVMDSGNLAALAGKFGPGTKEVSEVRETTLWDNWVLLTAAVAALTAEWILRRRKALA